MPPPLIQRIACHEAGHAVASYHFGFDLSGITTIVQDDEDGSLGFDEVETLWELDVFTASCRIVRLYAGSAAARHFSPTSDDDGSKGDDHDVDKLLQLFPQIDADGLKRRAEDFVAQHWSKIEAVASVLLAEGTVSQHDIRFICGAIDYGIIAWREGLIGYRKDLHKRRKQNCAGLLLRL